MADELINFVQKKVIIDLELQMKESEKNLASLSQSIKNLNDVKAKHKKANDLTAASESTLSQQLRKTKAELDANVRSALSSKGSLEELRNRVSLLRREFERAPIGSQRFKELQKEITESQKKILEIDKSSLNFKSNIGNYGQSIVSAFGKVTAALAAASGVIAFFDKSLQAYNDQISAQASLEQALGKTSDALLKQASALQQVTVYGDEAIVQGQAFLAQMGATEEQIKKLTPVVVDFAAAKQQDLSESFNIVAKSIFSSTNAMKRQGIEIEGTAGSTKRLDSAIENLNKKFKGQAQAIAAVGTGPIKQMKNNFGELFEIIGEGTAYVINPFVKSLSNIAIGIKELVTGQKVSETPWYTDLIKSFSKIYNIVSFNFVSEALANAIRPDAMEGIKKKLDIKEIVKTNNNNLEFFKEKLQSLESEYETVNKGSARFLELKEAIKDTRKEISSFDISDKENKTVADKAVDLERQRQIKLFNLEDSWRQRKVLEVQKTEDTVREISERNLAILSDASQLEAEHVINILEARNSALVEKSDEWFNTQIELQRAYLNLSLQDEELTSSQKIAIAAQTANTINKIEEDKKQMQIARMQQTVQAFQVMFTALSTMAGNESAFAAFAKAMAVADIAINTGKAIARGIAAASDVPFPGNLVAITTTIATILANIAQAKTILESAEPPAPPALKEQKKAKGGIIEGVGGIDTIPAKLTAGEAVINKTSTAMFAPLLSRINEIGGGVSFNSSLLSKKRNFYTGGVVTSSLINSIDNNINITSELARLFSAMPSPVVFVEDINLGQQRVTKVQSRANF